MADPLEGIWLKWKRAVGHFETLDRMVERFYEPDSYQLYPQLDADQRPTIRVRNVRQADLRFGVVIGDIVHNLRSCLDHLVYELSRPVGGGNPPSGTEFPLFLHPHAFRHGARGRSGRYRIRAVRRGAKGRIEALQPYHRRNDPDLFSLWQLHELSNIDKHRLVHVVTAAAQIRQVQISSSNPGLRNLGYETFPGPLEEDKVVVRFFVAGADDDTKLNADLTLEVAFDQRSPAESVQGESARHVLAKAADVIQYRVIPELRPFL